MEVKQVLSSRIEDIIFEHRNKAYGAYDLRQRYNRNVAIATAVAVSFLVLALISPLIIDRLTPATIIEAPPPPPKSIAELDAPPPLDETVPPPPPVEVPPPPVEIIQFVPPVVTTEIVDSEPPPTAKEIAETTTGAKSQEGEKDVPYSPPLQEQEILKKVEDNTIYEFADEMASFKGDYASYLQQHIKYPTLAIENGIQGTVHVSVLIGKDGSISEVKTVRDIGGGCGKEAERVIRTMPKWEPAKQNGNPVNIRMTIPVKFVLGG